MADYINPWIYDNKEFTSEDIGKNIGFVYLITNLNNNKKYIGKKIFFNTTKVKLKSQIKKKKVVKESDWKTYYSSSDLLNEEVKKIGEQNFRREIIHLCKSKSEMSYFETKEQFIRGCLESPEWYNSWISARINKSNLKSIFPALKEG